MSNVIVAVDGPAASGKSTVSKKTAEVLGYHYVDSGAVYRSITWAALEAGLDCGDADAVVEFLDTLALESVVVSGAVRCLVNGKDPGEAIREPRINENVSYVAREQAVRSRVDAWLRSTADLGSLVMEGRDIGTNVFPGADFKFYLDATPEERARRRTLDMKGQMAVSDVADSIRRRDEIDSGRKVSPLRVSEDAVVLETTGMSIDEVATALVTHVRGDGDPEG